MSWLFDRLCLLASAEHLLVTVDLGSTAEFAGSARPSIEEVDDFGSVLGALARVPDTAAAIFSSVPVQNVPEGVEPACVRTPEARPFEQVMASLSVFVKEHRGSLLRADQGHITHDLRHCAAAERRSAAELALEIVGRTAPLSVQLGSDAIEYRLRGADAWSDVDGLRAELGSHRLVYVSDGGRASDVFHQLGPLDLGISIGSVAPGADLSVPSPASGVSVLDLLLTLRRCALSSVATIGQDRSGTWQPALAGSSRPSR